MCSDKSDKKGRAGNISGGLIMVTIGILFLTGQLGLASIRDLWRYWPLFLIGMGIIHLAMGTDDERWGGITNVMLGVVFLTINFHWMGLDWRNGWPLILVAIGASLVIRAAFPSSRRRQDASGAAVIEEERHV